MVLFSFLESCISTESLFNVNLNFNFGNSGDNKEVKKNTFKLVIVKNDKFNYDLCLDGVRVSVYTPELKFAHNVPESSKNSVLPAIYIKKTQINRHISEIIHGDISTFYKNFIKSVVDHKNSLKIHIILNDVHVLMIGTPIFDNVEQIVFCQLFEIPYTSTETFNEYDNIFD